MSYITLFIKVIYYFAYRGKSSYTENLAKLLVQFEGFDSSWIICLKQVLLYILKH